MKNEITLSDLMNEFTKTNQKIDALDKKFESKFDLLDRRINALDQKFEIKFDQLNKKFEAKLDQLDKKFEAKFDMLFDAVGDINEKFTVMDYKFLQLKRQAHAA